MQELHTFARSFNKRAVDGDYLIGIVECTKASLMTILSESARGGHRNVPCTSICDGDQSEIKGSRTLASVNQRIKIEFRPQNAIKIGKFIPPCIEWYHIQLQHISLSSVLCL